MDRHQVLEIKKEFVQSFMLNGPFKGYINAIGLTNRTMAEWSKGGHTEPTEAIRERLTKTGENPEELIIHVGLVKALPENLSLPGEYKGVKLEVQVIGEIKAL